MNSHLTLTIPAFPADTPKRRDFDALAIGALRHATTARGLATGGVRAALAVSEDDRATAAILAPTLQWELADLAGAVVHAVGDRYLDKAAAALVRLRKKPHGIDCRAWVAEDLPRGKSKTVASFQGLADQAASTTRFAGAAGARLVHGRTVVVPKSPTLRAHRIRLLGVAENRSRAEQRASSRFGLFRDATGRT